MSTNHNNNNNEDKNDNKLPIHDKAETISVWSITCDGCRMRMDMGSFYFHLKNSNYDLCYDCFVANHPNGNMDFQKGKIVAPYCPEITGDF